MALWETSGKALRRKREQKERWPELDVADLDEIASVDAYTRTQGQEPSTFGKDSEDAVARLGFSPEEVTEIELDQRFGRRPPVLPVFDTPQPEPVERTVGGLDLTDAEKQRLDRTSGIRQEEIDALGSDPRTLLERITEDPAELRDFRSQFSKGFETLPGIEALEEFEPQRRDQGQPRFVERDLDLASGLEPDFGALIEGVRGAPQALADRTTGAAERTGDFGQALLPGGAAEQVITRPDVRDPETAEAVREIEAVAAAPIELGVSLAPIFSANFLDAEGRVDSERAITASLAAVSGDAFFESLTRTATGGASGLEDIGIDTATMNPLAHALLESLAPINFAAAAGGSGISAALRQAASNPALSARIMLPVRLALKGAAGAVEPFDDASFAGRLSREIAVDVAAQEGFRAAEGLPIPAKILAALTAGIVTASLTDPRVIGRFAAPSVPDATAGSRAASASRGTVIPDRQRFPSDGPLDPANVGVVLDPGTGQIRGFPRIGGAEDALDSARDAVRRGLTEAEALRATGDPDAALKAQQSGQAAGLARAMEDATDFDEARAGAFVSGTKFSEQTPLPPLALTDAQRTALFNEAARLSRTGDIGEFDAVFGVGTLLDRLKLGQLPRRFELSTDSPTGRAVRLVLGDEVVDALEKQAIAGGMSPDIPSVPRGQPIHGTPSIPESGTNLPGAPSRRFQSVDAALRDDETARQIVVRKGNEEVERIARRSAREEGGAAADLPATRQALPQEFPETAPRPDVDNAADRLARDQVRLHEAELKARVKAEQAELEQTATFNRDAVEAQTNARNAEEAKAFLNGQRVRENIEVRQPNTNNLLNRAAALMDRPITGTAPGEIPRNADTGLQTGPRPRPAQPRVPEELRTDVLMIIRNWVAGSDTILKNSSDEMTPLLGAVQAQLTGQLDSPLLTEAIHGRNILMNALRNAGVEHQTAKELSDIMMSHQLISKDVYGPGFEQIRQGRRLAERTVRQEIRAESGLQTVIKDADFQQRVNDSLEDTFVDRFGPKMLAQERFFQEQMKLMERTWDLEGLSKANQQFKATMFGATDFAVLGVNVNAAIHRGGVPILAKMVNDILAVLHLPHARNLYADGYLPRQVQNGLAGVDQSSIASPVTQGSGSILQHAPVVGRLDPYVQQVADKLADIQYGTILGYFRNSAYEGQLVISHLLGQDPTDPLNMATFARNANMVGGSARPALRGNRALAEDIAATSSRMWRARMNQITEMARLFDLPDNPITGKGATFAERQVAATTIVSTVIPTLVLGGYLQARFGVGDYVMDPSKPAFGLITIGGEDGAPGRVIDLIAQDSVVRAFARSIREISEGDLDESAQQWLKVYMGSASIPGKIPTAMFGYGYEPGSGFKFGAGMEGEGLTTQGKILNLAPLPVPVLNYFAEGWDSMGASLNFAGVGNFEESTFSEQERLVADLWEENELPYVRELKEAGKELDDLTRNQGRDILASANEYAHIDDRKREDLEEQVSRGDDTAKALILKYSKRDDLEGLYETNLASGSKAQYRDDRRGIQIQYIGESRAYEHIWRTFSESENEIEALAGQRYELVDQATANKVVDWDTLEELQAEFDAQIDPTQREEMMAFIESVDPQANPWEQELDILNVAVEKSGWWDRRDDTWIGKGFAEQTGFATYNEWRISEIARGTELHLADGDSPGVAAQRAEGDFMARELKQDLDEMLREERGAWLFESPDRFALADQMIEWGIWAKPSDDELEVINSRLK